MSASISKALTGDDARLVAPRGLLLGPLSIFARETDHWSPALLAGVLWRGLSNIGTQRQVLRLLKNVPQFAEAALNNPRFSFKYLAPDYLVQGFSSYARVSSFLHHYKRLYATLPDRVLRQIMQMEVTLHEIPAKDNRFALTMGLSRPYYKEGELSLNFHVDGELVFLLSFTIVPGWVVKSEAAETLLITRLQGMKGCYRQIYLATKALHDVSPAALLLAALQGVAMAFGIGEFAAVSAVRQTSYTEDSAAVFKKAYDDFFAETGMTQNACGFFVSPIPIEDKPLTFIKKGHKLRTKEKRAFKQSIQLACFGFFESNRAPGFAPASPFQPLAEKFSYR